MSGPVVVLTTADCDLLYRWIEPVMRQAKERGADEDVRAVAAAVIRGSSRFSSARSVNGSAQVPRPVPKAEMARDLGDPFLGGTWAGEAAVKLRVTPRRVRQLAARGELSAQLVAGRWLIDSASVAAMARAKGLA